MTTQTLVPASGALAVSDERMRTAAISMMGKPPYINDRRVTASLADVLGRKTLPVVIDHVARSDGWIDAEPKSIIRPRGITQEQIDRMLRILRLSMAPAPRLEISHRLQVLALSTAARAQEEIDIAQRAAIYTEKLAAYPADTVIEMLDRAYRFYPTWDELQRGLDALCRVRRFLLREISQWAPWGREDEIAWLRRAVEAARWDARYFAKIDPEKALHARTALEKHEKALAAIIGEGDAA